MFKDGYNNYSDKQGEGWDPFAKRSVNAVNDEKDGKFPDAEWEKMICECKASGLSDWQWCRENGIPTSSFYRHLKKFHNTTVAPLHEGLLPKVSGLQEVQEVVPLMIREEPPAAEPPLHEAPAVKLTVRGISFEIYNNAGSDVILNIIRAAGTLC